MMTENDLRLAPSRPEIAALPSLAGVTQAIFRQRWKMFLVMGIVFGAVALWTFLTPRSYTSQMLLLVQNVRSEEAVTSGAGGNTANVPDISEDQLNSEISVLNSDDVANGVVDPNWKPYSVDSMTQAQLRDRELAVRSFRARLELSPIRSSHVIDVKFTAPSARDAHNSLDDLLQSFLRKQRDLSRLPGASEVFSSKASEYERALQQARQKLTDYRKKNGFVSVQDQEGALQSKLLDAQSAQRDVSAQIAELTNRIAADNRQLSSTSKRLPTVENSSAATGTVDQLNVLLITLKNKRTTLLTKYEPNDRLVQEVDQQIKDTEDGLSRASRVSSRVVATDQNPLYNATEHDLSTSTVALAALRARAQNLAGQIGTLQSQIGTVETASGEYESLTQSVAELESSYKAFLAKRDAASMNDLMDEKKWLNIAVVQYPTMPTVPSRPKRFLNLLLGMVSAVILGACTVFFFEMLHQKVSTDKELQESSTYPVLASIPWLDGHNARRFGGARQLEAKS